VWLIGLRGLRRDEACGLRWSEFDLDRSALFVVRNRTTAGYRVVEGPPKTAAGTHAVALDAHTLRVLREHRVRQADQRARCLAAGKTRQNSGYVFVRKDGSPIHSGCVRCSRMHPGGEGDQVPPWGRLLVVGPVVRVCEVSAAGQVQRHGCEGAVVPGDGVVAQTGGEHDEGSFVPVAGLGNGDLGARVGVPVILDQEPEIVGKRPWGVPGADAAAFGPVDPRRLGEQPDVAAGEPVRSSGFSAVKAAIRTDSGTRICSNKASRSESSTGRSATSATSAPTTWSSTD
jgi:hypothetical protein